MLSQQLGNYEHLFRAVELSRLPFKITGDLHFIMPCFGLLGCSSSNPCVYCPRERRRLGGVAKWEEGDVELRTLGSLNQNYADWFEEGQRDGAQFTRKFKSVAGPILVEGAGDSFSTLVLDKAPPSQVLRPTSYGKWVGGPMSLKQGNFSFRARTAHNWLRMGEYGTYLEFCRSEEAPRHCQTSDSPTQSCARAHFRSPPGRPQVAPRSPPV